MAETRRRHAQLPVNLPPRGLSRYEAAAYVGVSVPLYDEMVNDGRMPVPKMINSRLVWDRLKVDAAFGALPDRGGEADPWKDLAV